jgi:ABC-type Mn2+/Zn2+ transport system ATPase subunit
MDNIVFQTDALSVGYAREVVVPGISISLSAGKVLALTGVNGSGKTTMLKTIAGLLPAISGKISVFGEAPGRNPARIAYLSQSSQASFLLPLRTIDLVRMSRFPARGLLGKITSDDEKLVRESMQFMGVGDLAEKPMSALSGGQRQRVFLSYVLARNADLVLLDEPTSNLDVVGIELYKDAVEKMKRGGASVILATHNIKEAASCDLAMLLARRVVASGPGSIVLTPETLLSTFGIIARFENGQVVVVEKEHGCDECP